MTKSQHDYLLTYLHDLEERIESKKRELTSYASYNGISVGSIASIASELTALYTEQRTICFTLRQLGFYVIYNSNHAESIVSDSEA